MLLSSAGGFSVSGFRVDLEGLGVQASGITGIGFGGEGLVVWALGFQGLSGRFEELLLLPL